MPSGISIIINIASEKVPQEAPRKMLSPVTPIPVKKKIRKKVKRNSTFPSDADPLRSTMASSMQRLTKTPPLKGQV